MPKRSSPKSESSASATLPTGVTTVELPGIRRFKSGKVREVFDLGDRLLFVASDRISAFDYILPNPIPDKGKILTRLSLFWFEHTASIAPNHVLTSDIDEYPAELKRFRSVLEGRSMIGKKAEVVGVECVARGYLSGSGWKEYRATQSVCGIRLPSGLLESSELPEPIFTPATKAAVGHDENISFDRVVDLVGKDLAERLRDLTLTLYRAAREYARSRGILLSDTKFEFGLRDGELILVDEILTPDSSRFWPADQYEPGRPQASYDKQFVRDYLESIQWNKQPPVPTLPSEVVIRTRRKYLEAYERLVGHPLPGVLQM